MKTFVLCLSIAVFSAAPAAAQHQHGDHAALNERGNRFMGFDQDATAHHFIVLKDGGRIEVTAKRADDAASIAQVRAHLREIAGRFSRGDFEIPSLVHDTKAVPGVAGMKAQAQALTFTFEEVERGGAVRIVARGDAALSAVHEFLRYQITDHRTGDPLIPR